MPIYEYECPKCGLFEVVQKASARALKCKPDCDDKNCPKQAKRLISAAAFHLKGSGWYKTDYASKSSTPPAKSPAPAVADAGADSASKPKVAKEAKDNDSSTGAKKAPSTGSDSH